MLLGLDPIADVPGDGEDPGRFAAAGGDGLEPDLDGDRGTTGIAKPERLGPRVGRPGGEGSDQSAEGANGSLVLGAGLDRVVEVALLADPLVEDR
jgi:hypothetical protein